MHPDFIAYMVSLTEERFWSKVEKRGPDECWPWIGGRGTGGYGSYTSFGGSTRAASREAYEMTNGPLPRDVVVCHRCDMRDCCNPRHLFAGSVADNNRDRDAKGRQNGPKGEGHPRATTTVEAVREIRRQYAAGIAQVEIAGRLGVSRQVVNQVIKGRSWTHVK